MLSKYSPFRENGNLLERMFGVHNLLSDFDNSVFGTTLPPMDVYETGTHFVVKIAAPGVIAEDVDVSVENNVLTIKGESRHEFVDENTHVYRRECRYGTFSRSIRLPEHVQADLAEASVISGFIEVKMPKLQTRDEPKVLKVPVR